MQFDQLKRREFITLLGGAAAARRLRTSRNPYVANGRPDMASRRHQCYSRRSCSRSLLRWTLPVAVRGRSWAISNRRGCL